MGLYDGMKEVEFNKYCGTCIHRDLKEHEDPCDSCLSEPSNQYSHKPVKYLEDVYLVRKLNKKKAIEESVR